MKPRIVFLAAAVAFLASVLSTGASAQYYVKLTGGTTGPGTCTSTNLSQPFVGTEIFNLPAATPNAVDTVSVDGGPPAAMTQSIPGPFPYTVSSMGIIDASPPAATTPPYTVVEKVYPYLDGAPTGLGVTATGVCNADGTANITYVNDVQLTVPALTPPLQVTLALLLAAAGAWRFRVTPSRRT